MTLAVDHASIVDQERFVASMQVEHADSTMEFLANNQPMSTSSNG